MIGLITDNSQNLCARIVCVAVLDILPGCLSSVYLYYDPDWWGQKPNLSPGVLIFFLECFVQL